jgi:protein disulfide-isomerase
MLSGARAGAAQLLAEPRKVLKSGSVKVFRTNSILATALVLLLAASSASAKPGWLTNLKQAQAETKANNKLLLVNFTGSDWCGYCIALDKEVFSKPSFKEYARQNFVLLDIDFPRGKRLTKTQKQQSESLADEHGVRGFPTIIVFDSSGNKLGQLGYMSGGPAAFIAALEKFRSR